MSDALCTRRQQQLVLSETGPSSESLDLDSVIVEILSWLPAKSLLRFRSVSKAWRTLISDPYFITKHLSRINPKLTSTYSLLIRDNTVFRSLHCEAIFDCYKGGPVPSRELGFPVIGNLVLDLNSIQIIGSCHGLMCLLHYGKSLDFIVWNPCTGECRVLPEPPLGGLKVKFYGFGYDSKIDDYKVVVGSYAKLPSSSKYVVVALTLKTGLWRKLRSLENKFRVLWDGCLINDALYWVLIELEKGGQRRLVASKLVSFDLAEERFCEIGSPCSPDPLERNLLVPSVENLGNSLFYCGTSSVGSRLDFTMWVMKECGVEKSWNEVMRIPYEVFPANHCKFFVPLCISDDGVTLIEVFDDEDGKSTERRSFLTLYNPKENICRNITENCVSEVAAYGESLVSPLTGSCV